MESMISCLRFLEELSEKKEIKKAYAAVSYHGTSLSGSVEYDRIIQILNRRQKDLNVTAALAIMSMA